MGGGARPSGRAGLVRAVRRSYDDAYLQRSLRDRLYLAQHDLEQVKRDRAAVERALEHGGDSGEKALRLKAAELEKHRQALVDKIVKTSLELEQPGLERRPVSR